MVSQEEAERAAKASVLNYSAAAARDVAERAVADKLDLLALITEGYTAGIKAIGQKYDRREIMLPQLMAAGNAMKAGVDVITPLLQGNSDTGGLGRFVICTIEGDIHSIGKDICAALLQAGGFTVINLGRDVRLPLIADAVTDNSAVAVGTSALMTTTMVNQKKFESIMEARGLKGRVVTNVGGGPVTQQWADEIGADVYSENAQDCVRKMIAAVTKRKAEL
ncbi:MAG: cobalamin-dependent protein [Methanomethylophilus sp.]|jgi:trimethylamine corrinoid protein